jgi:16S rRNA (adenine1518-N6/adenine1519-N6)-dimethyltransferase
VLEVGPGLGSLTLALLDRGARVTAVEIDPILARQLPKTIAEHSHSEINRLTVLNRDILTVRRPELEEQPTALVANLPYNVAVPALLHLLAEFPSIRTVMVMVQAEVAERLAAEPGGKDYGVPSVKVRFYGNVRRYGMVSPTVFWPIPRVYSGLVRIDRHETTPWPTDTDFRNRVFELIDVAFAQRRKTSRNAFAEWAGSGNESARRLLAASIDDLVPGVLVEELVHQRRLRDDGVVPGEANALARHLQHPAAHGVPTGDQCGHDHQQRHQIPIVLVTHQRGNGDEEHQRGVAGVRGAEQLERRPRQDAALGPPVQLNLADHDRAPRRDDAQRRQVERDVECL